MVCAEAIENGGIGRMQWGEGGLTESTFECRPGKAGHTGPVSSSQEPNRKKKAPEGLFSNFSYLVKYPRTALWIA